MSGSALFSLWFLDGWTTHGWQGAVWRACWQATVIFLIVAAITMLLRDRMAPRWQFVLWLLVLIRLMLPALPDSRWSVYALIPANLSNQQTTTDAVASSDGVEISNLNQVPVHSSKSSDDASIAPDRAKPDPASSPNTFSPTLKPVTNNEAPDQSQLAVIQPAPKPSTGGLQPARWFAIVWSFGVITGVLYFLGSIIRLRRFTSDCTESRDEKKLSCLAELCETMGISRPPLMLAPGDCAPFVAGVMRPAIYLSESTVKQFSPEQLRHVLTHELTHIRRRDVLTQWIFLLVRTLYWFHPIVWLTGRQLSRCREQACDDAVLANSPERTRCDYGQTLLHLAARCRQPRIAAGLCGMFATRNTWRRRVAGKEISQRVKRIADHQNESRAMMLVAMMVIAIVSLVSLTDASAQINNAVTDAVASTDTGPSRDQSFTISGRVHDLELNGPLTGAGVKVYSFRGLDTERFALVGETQTDKNGVFFVDGLVTPHGSRFDRLQYVVVFHAQGKAGFAYPVYAVNAHDINIAMQAADANVKGRVVNKKGLPVMGAVAQRSTLYPPSLVQQQQFTSKADGTFFLGGVPSGEVYLQVTHPDYPKQYFARESGQYSTVTLQPGTEITGRVVARQTGQALGGKHVAAIPWEPSPSTQETFAKTDDQGRFRIIVNPGTYKLILEDPEWVMEAKKLDCRKDQPQKLGDLSASQGGWIVGRILHAETGQPVINSNREGEENVRVTLGLFGPSRPKGNLMYQRQLAEVDARGRYRLRAWPGDNYPYVYNLGNTTRTCFNTTAQPPVVVRAGKETTFDFAYTPIKTPEQLMAEAQKVLDSLPTSTEQRIAAIIDEFRKLNHTVDQCELWCSLMRELVAIGPPAVPALCNALDSATENRMLRRLAFALRAIGDRRAVPALIRAVPKTLLPSSSDYGLLVKDAELTQFMQKHQITPGRGQHFGFGRPVREVHEALRRLTGHGPKQSPLNWISRRKDLRAQVKQQQMYFAEAKRWEDWWEQNWQRLGVIEADSKVNLPIFSPPDLSDYPGGLGLTDQPERDGGSGRDILSPIGDTDNGTFFLDLDVGGRMGWPKELDKRDGSPESIASAEAWAKKSGVDLMCQMMQTDDDKVTYVLAGIGMQLWEIDPFDAKNIDDFLKRAELPKTQPIDGKFLLHRDPESGELSPTRNSSFLYLTSDQGLGIITVTDFVTEKRNMAGAYAAPPQGVGRNRGVRFRYHAIAR